MKTFCARMLASWLLPSGLLFACLPVLLAPAACGTYAGNPGTEDTETLPTSGGGKGTLNVSLTDAPADDVAKVFVRVSALDVLKSDGTWISLPLSSPEEIELTALQGGLTLLLAKNVALDAGAYEQLRLVLTSQNPARLIRKDGTGAAVKVPSGSSSGIKVKFRFSIAEGKETRLVIDFDVRKSLVKTGGGPNPYLLKPVLRVVDHVNSGQIAGSAFSGFVRACVFDAVSAVDATSECGAAITSAPLVNGSFKTSLLPQGRYSVRLFPSEGAFRDLPRDVTVRPGQVTSVVPD